MGTIAYNFEANRESLEFINSHLNEINVIRTDIATMFTKIAEVYQGSGQEGLSEAERHVGHMLDECLEVTANLQKMANEQQDIMQALDIKHGSSF